MVRLPFAALIFFSLAANLSAQNLPDPPSPVSPEVVQPSPTSPSFIRRLAAAYREDWSPSAASSTEAPERRGFPAPLDSPPFPSTDYSVGGTPIIGAPDTQSYMLMQAINGNRSRTKIYGWFNGGFNVSTSNKGDGANAPAAYYYNPNRVTPDQEVLYIERLPNTVGAEHVDYGFRFATLYGQDIDTPQAKESFLSNSWRAITNTASTPSCFTWTSTCRALQKE